MSSLAGGRPIVIDLAGGAGSYARDCSGRGMQVDWGLGPDLAGLVTHELLLFAAVWLLVGGLDELAIDLLWFRWLWARTRPEALEFEGADQPADDAAPLAVFVAAWREQAVIGQMIAHCLDHWKGENFVLFVAIYANDHATQAAAARAAHGTAQVRLVVNPLAGPTSKADNLNALWHAMRREEVACGRRFAGVAVHDAEDVVHPLELGLFRRALVRHDFVQLPVIPLVDPQSRWVGGHYCDEFAESHLRTLPVRAMLTGSFPGAGTGCALSRDILDRMAGPRAPFAADSLTEDYEMGLRVGEHGGRGCFVRVRDAAGEMVAVRAYFPHAMEGALRQKTRWTTGISLQGWDRLGWQGSLAERWMLARDRRPPLAAAIIVAAYMGFILLNLLWLVNPEGWLLATGSAPILALIVAANFVLLGWRVAMRGVLTGYQYGWREGLRSVPRVLIANVIAILAARRALAAYWQGLSGATLAWDKTEHRIPAVSPYEGSAASREHRQR